MRILILNWRDIKNPSSGGAEILTHEMAKRWVTWGNKVTQISSLYPRCKKEEYVDGVRILRSGYPDGRSLWQSVHYRAHVLYKRYFKGNIDVIIDEAHGIPFFTPLYAKEKKILLICEVADRLWIESFGILFGTIGRIVEQIYLRLVYRNLSVLTISESVKTDLVKNGVLKRNVQVLPMGVNLPKRLPVIKKEKDITLILVGRLTKSKGIETAIETLRAIKATYPGAKLWIAGRGDYDYQRELLKLSNSLGLRKSIKFMGFVTEKKKFELLARAWILIHPSTKEGWGLNVIEANAVGTPAIGYKISGLRDSIRDGYTGVVLSARGSQAIASAIYKIAKNSRVYKRYSDNARKWTKHFSWEQSAKTSLEILSRGNI